MYVRFWSVWEFRVGKEKESEEGGGVLDQSCPQVVYYRVKVTLKVSSSDFNHADVVSRSCIQDQIACLP